MFSIDPATHDEAEAVDRQHDDEEHALFVAESDRLEYLITSEYRRSYAGVLALNWGALARHIASAQSWPEYRAEVLDAFTIEVRQYAAEYSWPDVWHCFARAMRTQQEKAA